MFSCLKNAAAILLLVLVASVQTPLGQLLKLPLLVEHYCKHQQQTGLSLIDFLDVHYTGHHKDADYPEDQQLPFKNIRFHTMGYALVTSVYAANTIAIPCTEQKLALPGFHLPQQNPGSIFHPPRM